MQKRSVVSSRADRKSAVQHERKQLIQLALTLSRELALLREDNQQLRAAVEIYRELQKRTPTDHTPCVPEAGVQ